MQFPLDNRQANQERSGQGRHNIRAGSGASIRQATLITMVGMFLAKLTGFLREMLIVPKFGYGLLSDTYVNAFQIPDLVYELLVGGVVAAVLTPTLSAGIEKHRERETWHSVSVFASLSILLTATVLLLAEVLAYPLIHLITGAYAADASDELKQMAQMAAPLTHILLIQSFLLILVSLLHSSLSAYKRFQALALGPVLYNVFYILALIFWGAPDEEGLRKVAWGVVLSAFCYFLYQAFCARRELAYFAFSLDFQEPGFRRLVRLAIPTILSGSVLQLSSVIMNRYANGLNLPGAVTAIRQCTTTWGLPYAIFAVAIGNVMLPNISGFYELGDAKKVRAMYTASLRRALYFVAPFALSFMAMNFETIQAIFQWNSASYSNLEVQQTASALSWFCLSMLAQTVIFITNQAFYARKVTGIALFVGLLSLALNPLFLYLFVGVGGKGLAGIGMAHAAYSCLTALVVFALYKRHRQDMRPYRLLAFNIRLFVCLAAAWLVLHSLNSLPVFPTHKILQLALYALKIFAGIFTYYLAGIALRFREALDLQNTLRRTLGLRPVQEA